jgi:glutathione synthase
VVGKGDGISDVSVIHAPFSLFPTPFPAAEFQRVQRLMPHFSALVHAISADTQYLTSTLQTAAEFDDFTRGLLDVFAKTADDRAKYASQITLGLHRSDYMLDEPSGDLLQARAPYLTVQQTAA